MTIDNCTRCDMCVHENVCGKMLDYKELNKRVVDSLTDRYNSPIDAILNGMNSCITLTCLDYVREVKVR